MIKTFSTFLLLTISMISPVSDFRSEVEEIIKSYFSTEIRLDFLRYEIPKKIRNDIEKESGQKFFKDFLDMWEVYQGDELTATALIDNVYGKSQPITFMLIINRRGEIIATEIIKYREPYGGQISNKRWLKQFEGKDISSSFKTGDEISTISGATISVNSITRGIKKLVLLINKISEGK